MITFLEDHGIESKEEENGRILLKSNKSCQLVDFLIEKNQANETVIQMENEVLDIKQKADGFLIHTTKGDYHTKKVILAS